MNKKGFSLIELMIVVAIIAIAAMLVIPNFKIFMGKTKRTEAYTNLKAIYTGQKVYQTEHGKYSEALAGTDGVGWKPDSYKGPGTGANYTYGLSSHGTEGVNYLTGKLNTSHTHLSRAHADEKGFVAVAAGDIDGDGEPDILTIDETGEIRIVQDDLAD